MYRTDNYSQNSSIIRPVWLNGWVFAYKPNGYEIESRLSNLTYRYGVHFEQVAHWHLGNYKVWIHSETRM